MAPFAIKRTYRSKPRGHWWVNLALGSFCCPCVLINWSDLSRSLEGNDGHRQCPPPSQRNKPYSAKPLWIRLGPYFTFLFFFSTSSFFAPLSFSLFPPRGLPIYIKKIFQLNLSLSLYSCISRGSSSCRTRTSPHFHVCPLIRRMGEKGEGSLKWRETQT